MTKPEHSYQKQLYLWARRNWGGRKTFEGDDTGFLQRMSLPYEAGRDPNLITKCVQLLIKRRGWLKEVQRSQIIELWPELVGAQLSEKTRPMSYRANTLEVMCMRDAYRIQMRIQASVLLANIQKNLPDAEIEDLRFLGPEARSWKRGPYSVPGRGPRDTYD